MPAPPEVPFGTLEQALQAKRLTSLLEPVENPFFTAVGVGAAAVLLQSVYWPSTSSLLLSVCFVIGVALASSYRRSTTKQRQLAALRQPVALSSDLGQLIQDMSVSYGLQCDLSRLTVADYWILRHQIHASAPTRKATTVSALCDGIL